MMRNVEYIIVEERGHKVPILFDTVLEHSNIGRNMRVISAGQCYIIRNIDNDIAILTAGRNVKLNVETRPEDGEIITAFVQHKFYQG